MTTVTWILAAIAGWTGFLFLVVALLTAAKRGDEAVARAIEAGPPAAVDATSELLGRLVLDVRGVLGVERVAVVMPDVEAPGKGVIEACCGRPELVGSRVQAGGGFGWGVGPESSFLIDESGGWSVVSVPIDGADGVEGTVAVATQRRRGLTPLDVQMLERLSRRATRLADDGRARPARRSRRRHVV